MNPAQTAPYVHSVCFHDKIVSEYDQKIPQLQTADNPVYIEKQKLHLKSSLK